MKKRSPHYREAFNLGQSRTPADLLSQQRALDSSVSLANKAPVNVSSVVSSYDARPINALDFEKFFIFPLGTAPNFSAQFIVPDGKVAVLKNVSWHLAGEGYILDAFGLLSAVSFRVDILVDGIFDNQYQNLTFPIADNLPVYVIANSGQLVELRITFPLGQINSAEIHLYGQLLLASGRATNYEPGTQYAVPVKAVE